MPTYLRHFYIKKAQQYYEKEKEQIDKANKKHSSGISRPGISRGG